MAHSSAASRHRSHPRENFVLAHVALVALATSWLLGGIGPRLEWLVAALTTPAYYFLFAEARTRLRSHDRAGFRRLLRWTAPLAALATFVVISALNPSHQPAFLYDTYVLRRIACIDWLPASALPLASLRVLACLGGLAATGLTLAFCVHSRRALRSLLILLAFNALALAVLGTLQRQAHVPGPFLALSALLIAATAPLSSSRSSTVLMAL
ncbi:MAG: hypothetical protein RL376_432, partial [Verrucomicrobiota bacterium]